MSIVVGLTGGIGSGKSTAADAFAALGARIIDTDVIAHQLSASGGEAIAALRAAFGASIITPDGALDRTAMRRRVFADPAERAQLEAILHPLIRAASAAEIERAAGVDYCVLVVPLLVESGDYLGRVDRVAVVDCPEEMQITRVMARNQLSRTEAEAILAAQASRAARLAVADDVICNNGSLAALQARIAELDLLYRVLAKNSAHSTRCQAKTGD